MNPDIFSWTIDNFLYTTQRAIYSPCFTIPDHPQIEWRLKLYPRGDRNTPTDFVTIYLCKMTDKFDAEIEAEFAIVGADKNAKSKILSYYFGYQKNSRGWPMFVSRNQLTDNLLVNGKLMLQVRNVSVIQVVELKDCLVATVFNWDIDNFVSKDAVLLTSDTFTIPGHPLIKWHLNCYPNGEGLENKGFLTIDIEKCTGDCEIEIECQLAVVGCDDKLDTASIRNIFGKIKTQGWYRFISRDEVINDGYLIDGSLKIQLKVFRILKADYLNEYLNHCINKEFPELDSANLYDFCLKTNDKTFDVHKLVLARESPYFRKMFENSFKEKEENEVDLSQFQSDVIQEVLRFVYTGQLQNFDRLCDQLIYAADYFQIDHLKNLCQENMTFRISLDNFLQFLLIADQVNASLLKETALRFLYKNKSRIHKQLLRRFFKEHLELGIECMLWDKS